MTTTLPSRTSGQRLLTVDALRGFALLGIVIVHMLEQYLASGTPKAHHDYAAHHNVDHFFLIFSGVLLQGKFFAIFSFLFGLSFHLQMETARRQQEPFLGRFVWRMVLLFAIGAIHSLFYGGDILTIYAMVGVGLVFFYRASNVVLLVVAGLFMAGLPRILIWAYKSVYAVPDMDWEALDPQLTQYYNTVKSGHLGEIFMANATFAFPMKLFFQFDSGSRAYMTFGLFLLGIWVGRIRFFEQLEQHRRFIKRGIWVSLGLIVIIALVLSYLFSKITDYNSLPAMLGMGLSDLGNDLIAWFEVSIFLLLCLGKYGSGIHRNLAPYGKMALTNYVTQSLIGTFLFFGWGLGQLGNWGASINFGIAIAVYLLQVQGCKWWLHRYQYGPLEWLWRSGTQLHWAPLRVRKQAD